MCLPDSFFLGERNLLRLEDVLHAEELLPLLQRLLLELLVLL